MYLLGGYCLDGYFVGGVVKRPDGGALAVSLIFLLSITLLITFDTSLDVVVDDLETAAAN